MNIGYCCINLTLNKKGVTTNRTMRKATFLQKGIPYASELALQNVQDLQKIIQWNIEKDIKVFRITSDLFPWASEYSLSDLPDYESIASILHECGRLAKSAKIRLSAHPGHFVKLASVKEEVVQNSIKDLEIHSEFFDLMGLEASHWNPLNIHVGCSFSKEVSARFCQNFSRLSPNLQKRLVVENDDKESCYSVEQILETITDVIRTPITFDYFHHSFHSQDIPEGDAARLAADTWNGIKPLFHYSDSKNIYEEAKGNPRAHADWIYNRISDHVDCDIDLEAKAKELALFKYQEFLL
jgi:UV DNA damage endonuclease